MSEGMTVIQIMQFYGVKLPESFLHGEELTEAVKRIEKLSENILSAIDDRQKERLTEQLTELENACFSKVCLELDEYFKQGVVMGLKLAKELNIK